MYEPLFRSVENVGALAPTGSVGKKWHFHVPTHTPNAGFEAFTAAMFQVEVFWVVTPCSVVVGY
jgi:hypothetical protein